MPNDKYSAQLHLVLYLPLDSHLELHISYRQTGDSASTFNNIYFMIKRLEKRAKPTVCFFKPPFLSDLQWQPCK